MGPPLPEWMRIPASPGRTPTTTTHTLILIHSALEGTEHVRVLRWHRRGTYTEIVLAELRMLGHLAPLPLPSGRDIQSDY